MRFFVWCLALAYLLSTTGCTSVEDWPESPPSGPIPYDVDVGDEVRVEATDGSVYEFVITEITADRLIGENESVALSEIRDVKRLESDAEDSSISAAALLGIALLVALGFALISGLEGVGAGALMGP